MKAWGVPLALVAGLIGLWAGVVAVFDIAPYLLPSPAAVAEALWSGRADLAGHVWATASVAVVGLGVAAAVAVALAVPIAVWPPVRRSLYPVLVATQSVPMVALAPLLIVWFGFGSLPRVLVVVLVAFFPILVATVAGLGAADRDQLDLLRSLGARRRDLVRWVAAPGAIGPFFAGLRTASAYAMFAAVVAEWAGAQAGLGLYLTRSQRAFRTDQVFAAVALVAVVSLALFAVVSLLARLATPWDQPDRPVRPEESHP